MQDHVSGKPVAATADPTCCSGSRATVTAQAVTAQAGGATSVSTVVLNGLVQIYCQRALRCLHRKRYAAVSQCLHRFALFNHCVGRVNHFSYFRRIVARRQWRAGRSANLASHFSQRPAIADSDFFAVFPGDIAGCCASCRCRAGFWLSETPPTKSCSANLQPELGALASAIHSPRSSFSFKLAHRMLVGRTLIDRPSR